MKLVEWVFKKKSSLILTSDVPDIRIRCFSGGSFALLIFNR